MLSILLERGVSPKGTSPFALESGFFCPLQAALAHAKRDIALMLLEHVDGALGCSPERFLEIQNVCDDADVSDLWTFSFRTPFTCAVLAHMFDIADELLKRGANPNKSYLDHLSIRMHQHLDVYWTGEPEDWDEYMYFNSVSPLQTAVYRGNTSAVEFCLKAGSVPNYPNPVGFSSLALALYAENEHITELLLERGAYLSLEDLYLFVKFAREDRKWCGETQDFMEILRCRERALHALEKVIEELELERSQNGANTLIKRRCHATVTQFRMLQEEIVPWFSIY